MKQKLYIWGLVTFMVIAAGTIFKVNHWPGAGYLLMLGIGGLVLVLLPAAIISHYRNEGNRQNRTLHFITWLTLFVIFTSMLFKIQHWPLAGILLTIAIPFPFVVFLPVFIVTTSKNKNFSIYNTVAVLLLLAAFSVLTALLALNVSKERIDDSFNLARNYNRTESAADRIIPGSSSSGITQKIDDVLKIIYEYKDLILRAEGLSLQEWDKGTGYLLRPDSRQVAIALLSSTGNATIGDRLNNAMKALLSETEKTPGYKDLAGALPVILDLKVQDENAPSLVWENITNTLSWTLIYLDGVETNLKLIKAAL